MSNVKALEFDRVHTLASKSLEKLCDRPLEIDFHQWRLIKIAYELSDQTSTVRPTSFCCYPLTNIGFVEKVERTPEKGTLLCVHRRTRSLLRYRRCNKRRNRRGGSKRLRRGSEIAPPNSSGNRSMLSVDGPDLGPLLLNPFPTPCCSSHGMHRRLRESVDGARCAASVRRWRYRPPIYDPQEATWPQLEERRGRYAGRFAGPTLQ